MINSARNSGRNLRAMSSMAQMMDTVGFTDIIENTNSWPLHAYDAKSEALAKMVRANFEKESLVGLTVAVRAPATIVQ
jgi:hypothetical protein